jgi:hypothetical protein
MDWMALSGVNLALAFTGQEEVFRKVYTNLGNVYHWPLLAINILIMCVAFHA